MKFGIILFLLVSIGSLAYATPSWMTPEMQEALAEAEAFRVRMEYATTPERVAEVFAALDAEIIRLERLPRRHRYSDAIQEIIPNLKQMRDNHINNDLDWSRFPSMLYSKLNVVRTTIDKTSQIR